MITQTSEIAVKAMIYLVLKGAERPIPPHEIASEMGCSPTYLSKVMGQLVKVGLLRSQRGPQGGMMLARKPENITLLAIIEGCQGLMSANYCRNAGEDDTNACGFHKAMHSIRQATLEAMGAWTLKELADHPAPTGLLAGNKDCRLRFLQENGAADHTNGSTEHRRGRPRKAAN